MPTAAKAAEIESLRESFTGAKVAVVANFTALTAEEVTALRRTLRAKGAKVKVVKNTLAKIAAEGTGMEKVKDAFTGPVMVTFGYDEDISAPAKTILDFAKGSKDRVTVVGGMVEGSAVDAAGVKVLADMPPKPVVQAMFLGLLQAPARSFLGLLTNVPRSLMNVMSNYAEKQQKGEG
ncbi:MAG: 50S ribosomal protein L10 [Nitrospinae bacterium]|nr:50S ribosomal protein L10 [Nitrospinota bacterium]